MICFSVLQVFPGKGNFYLSYGLYMLSRKFKVNPLKDCKLLIHLVFSFTLSLIYFLNEFTGKVTLPTFSSSFLDFTIPAHQMLFAMSSLYLICPLQLSPTDPHSHFPPLTDLTTDHLGDVWRKPTLAKR